MVKWQMLKWRQGFAERAPLGVGLSPKGGVTKKRHTYDKKGGEGCFPLGVEMCATGHIGRM